MMTNQVNVASADFNDERVLHHCDCALRTEVVAFKNIVFELESVKDAVATLERYFTVFLEERQEMAETAGTIKGSRSHHLPSHCNDQPVPPTLTPCFPPATNPRTSNTSWTTNRATNVEFCATTPTGPDFDTMSSMLPFSREQLR